MPTINEAFTTEEETEGGTGCRVLRLRQEFENFEINRKPDPGLRRELEAGFLLPYLLESDALIFGRWDYWLEADGTWPDSRLPHPAGRLDGFRTRPDTQDAGNGSRRGPVARKMAEHGRVGVL